MAPKYIPQLDGLRAIAALLVIATHLWGEIVTFGWIGVDFFFVLSGFLISRILFAAKGTPDYFSGFYKRRALRILPIYFITLSVVIIWTLLIDANPAHELRGLPYYFFYLQNIAYQHGRTIEAMFHTWSLGIEEQFYTIWPLLIFLLPIFSLKRVLYIGFVTAIAFRFIEPTGPGYVFGCMDGFIVGSYVALLEHTSCLAEKTNKLAAWTIILLMPFLLYTSFSYGTLETYRAGDFMRNPYSWLMLSVYALIFGAVLVLAVNQKLLPRLLSSKILTNIGKVSYGIYLYHFVIRYFLIQLHSTRQEIRIWMFILLPTICYFSWKYIESPLMRLARQEKNVGEQKSATA